MKLPSISALARIPIKESPKERVRQRIARAPSFKAFCREKNFIIPGEEKTFRSGEDVASFRTETEAVKEGTELVYSKDGKPASVKFESLPLLLLFSVDRSSPTCEKGKKPKKVHPAYTGAFSSKRRFNINDIVEWWDASQFISPLVENYESRFSYKGNGSIEAAVAGDSAVVSTIEKLNLDCDRLREARKKAVMKAGLHKRAMNPLMSESKVKTFIKNLSQQQSNGFIEFCTVLEQVASDYIQSLQKRAKRRRYAPREGR